MPPKKSNAPSKKAVEKVKNKIIEDKTFGLKNKNKSKTVQKYVQSVASQVDGGQGKKRAEALAEKKRLEKEADERAKLERALFQPTIIQQKVPAGVDPKSVVCEYFKKGLCTKGDKCKFSHNLGQERKAEKIDIYTDKRQEDTMDTWDTAKLENVVAQKRGVNQNAPTKIVCKYFLEAIEDKKYGWFWECPNGGDKCQYQHCLPPGYVLKPKNKKEDQEEEEETPIEEIIEEERNKLTTRTPLTKEIFLKWKEEKFKRQDEENRDREAKREADIKSGKAMRSGREMFMFNPDLFVDEEGVLDTEELEPEEDDNEPVIHLEATGTSITSRRTGGDAEFIAYDEDGNLIGKDDMKNGKEEEDLNEKMGQATVGDESLFNEDDVPDVSDEDEPSVD